MKKWKRTNLAWVPHGPRVRRGAIDAIDAEGHVVGPITFLLGTPSSRHHVDNKTITIRRER